MGCVTPGFLTRRAWDMQLELSSAQHDPCGTRGSRPRVPSDAIRVDRATVNLRYLSPEYGG